MAGKVVNGEPFISPVVRSSYNYIFSPRLPQDAKEGDRARYSITGLILPPDQMATDIDRQRWVDMQAAIAKVGKEAIGDKFKVLSDDNKIKLPVRKDVKSSGFPEEFAYFLRAWSYDPPGVVSIYRDPATGKAAEIHDPNQVYSGSWVRLSLRPWCMHHEKSGWVIGLTLLNVQWVKDDKRLDGRQAATDAFDAEGEAPAGGYGNPTGGSDKDELAALLGA